MHDACNDILARLNAGQEGALRQLMKTYSRPLLYFADSMVSDVTVAEEIVQDSFVKLWNRHRDFQTAANIKAFLYITIKNACLNYLKQAKHQYTEDSEVADTLVSADRDLLTQIIHAELITELYREVERLPEQYARIFRMSYLEDKTTQEICAQLGITPNAVFTGRSKATTLLRKAFKRKNLMMYFAFCQLVNSADDLLN